MSSGYNTLKPRFYDSFMTFLLFSEVQKEAPRLKTVLLVPARRRVAGEGVKSPL